MNTAIKVMAVSMMASTAAFAQVLIPVNPGSVDYITDLQKVIYSLIGTAGGLFLAEGQSLLTGLAIIMTVVYGLKWGLASVSRHHQEFDFPAMVHFFVLFLVAEMLIRYYNTPLWFIDESVHQILPEMGRKLAGFIDISALNTLTQSINDIVFKTEAPSIWDPALMIVYLFVLGGMVCMQAILFAATALSFVAIGLATILGPILIPWLIVPRLSFLFWNWLSFSLQYSFYQVVAAVLTYIWATAINAFLQNSVNGDYSVGHFFILLPAMGMFILSMALSMFLIPRWTSDLFTGAATAGAVMAEGTMAAVRGAFA